MRDNLGRAALPRLSQKFGGLQRSATVPGRSNVGSSTGGQPPERLSTFHVAAPEDGAHSGKRKRQWFGRFLGQSLPRLSQKFVARARFQRAPAECDRLRSQQCWLVRSWETARTSFSLSRCCARGRGALRKRGRQWFGRFLRQPLPHRLLHLNFHRDVRVLAAASIASLAGEGKKADRQVRPTAIGRGAEMHF